MPVPHQVADEASVFVHLLRPGPVADARGLDDRVIGGLALGHKPGHRIHQRDHAVIVHVNVSAGIALHDVDERRVGLVALRGHGWF